MSSNSIYKIQSWVYALLYVLSVWFVNFLKNNYELLSN